MKWLSLKKIMLIRIIEILSITFTRKSLLNTQVRTIRLHFFKEKFPPEDIFNLDKYNDKYIGYSIIRPTRINSIGRTIIDPCAHSKISGVLCKTNYKVHVLGAELKIEGFPYISQDTDVTVCAHAACWMVFRYFSERYTKYREILPYEISQMTEDISFGRLVPSRGLTVFQVTEIFSRFGFYPIIYMRSLGQIISRGFFTIILSPDFLLSLGWIGINTLSLLWDIF